MTPHRRTDQIITVRSGQDGSDCEPSWKAGEMYDLDVHGSGFRPNCDACALTKFVRGSASSPAAEVRRDIDETKTRAVSQSDAQRRCGRVEQEQECKKGTTFESARLRLAMAWGEAPG